LGTYTKLLVILTAVTLLAGIASAGVNGAIYTTNFDRTTVNGNIYPSKDAVYLSGGPQNTKDPGLVPDGLYYFQVTDPSGAVLLSTDDVTCRQVVVLNGRVDGVPTGGPPATCTTGFHANGTQNDANGALPVQLIPYNDTPNNGGVYKAWMTPVVDYGELCAPNHAQHGFCDKDSKTDNFKIRTPGSTTAFVTVCKFNDQNDDSVQQATEPLIPHWPITATGVDGGTVSTQTDDNGCISFSASGIQPGQTQQVTLTEGTQGPDWIQTAPADGTCSLTGTVNAVDTCTVSGGVITLTLSPSDDANAPNFGNFNPNCTTGCAGNQVIVTKDANPIVTYTWKITKAVDKTEIDTAPGGATTFKYTVDVSHDTGTATMTGTIRVSNATDADITNVTVSDAVSDAATDGGVCSVEAGAFHDGTGTVPAGSHIDVHYSCTFTGVPAGGTNTNTGTATWVGNQASGTASFDFGAATIVDGSVTVTDPLAPINPLGTASYTDTNPIEFKYSNTVAGTVGTCVTVNNTATFTTNTTGTTGTASQSVKVCEGADLTVTKSATPTFTRTYNWSINKSVDKTKVEQSGGSVTFNYTVVASETGFTDSAWALTGAITVTNPNTWEAIILTGVTEIAGCSITSGNPTATIPAGGSTNLSYSCSFGSGASGTNTATAAWNAATSFTTDGSASGNAAFAFTTPTALVNQTVTPTDSFNGGSAVNLCTLDPSHPPCTLTAVDTTPYTSQTYKYSRTIKNGNPGTCTSYTNTAVTGLTGTGQSSSQTVTVCNIGTGALTMGFWKNTNGQGIIKTYCGGTSGTSLMTYLNGFNPFKDDTAATCSGQASYVSGVITKASCTSSTNTCNAMLRAQMLATALDVYFSTPSLGGNRIGAYNGLGTKTPALGGVAVDLSHICNMIDGTSGSNCTGTHEDSRPEFGILAPCLGTTVGQMLSYSNFPSGVNGNPVATATTGASWYLQNKTKQVLAKDGFDNFNNQTANIAPTSCNSTF
jgi:hypothetical protein